MAEIGVGVVGTGWVSGEHIKAYQKNPHTELKAFCALTEAEGREKAHETNAKVDIYTDLRKMLERKDIQLVSICSPHNLHTQQAILCAQAGKHIVLEKPVSLNMTDLKALRDAIKKAGVKTVTSFVLRWNPLYNIIESLLKDDAIGKVFYGEVDYMHGIGPWYKQYWWNVKKELGGSSLLTAGIHAVDGLLLFMGGDVAEVSAFSTKGEGVDFKEYEYDPSLVVIAKFRNGSIGKVLSSIDCKTPYVFHISLLGSKGTIRNNKLFSHKFAGQTSWVDVPTILPDSGDVTHHPFSDEINHLVDCILKNKETILNIDWTYKVHEFVFAADKSAEEGKPVTLPLA